MQLNEVRSELWALAGLGVGTTPESGEQQLNWSEG